MRTELNHRECLELLARGSVGRVAFCTPRGPEIIPVNYTLVEESLVFRTTPYGALATHGRGAPIAFEVDELDPVERSGASVVARGRCDWLDERTALEEVRLFHDPEPWAPGARFLYLRLEWDVLSGRRVGLALQR